MGSESTPLLLNPQSGPLPWDPKRSRIAGGVILLTLTLERLAFYALVTNLFVYLIKGTPNYSSWGATEAMTAVLVLVGWSYFSALIGGWLSDALLGRFWTIFIGFVSYIFGFALLTALSKHSLSFIGCNLSEFNDTPTPCVVHVYVIVFIVGLGVGIVKANIPPFGAEQVRHGGPESMRKFFNWYYWCINVGSVIGVGALSFVEQELSNGFFWAFLSATICLFIALVCFCLARPYYLIHRPTGSLLTNIVRIIFEGIAGRFRQRRSIQSSPIFAFPRQRRSRTQPRASPSWLDYAKIRYGGSHHDSAVEDVKRLGAIVILFTCLLPYWLVFFQIETGFQAQGVHLNVDIVKNNSFRIPTSWLTLFDQAFILALIPIMNTVIYPALDGYGIRITLLARIAIGMGFSVAAGSSAGLLEYFSLRRWAAGHQVVQTIGNSTYNASDISLLWQVPQYCLVGTAEVFAGVAGLEFSYSAAPRSLQGVVMGLFSAMEGVGSFLGTALVSALAPVWIHDDTTHFTGHLDYYFFLLAGLQGFTLILFSAWLAAQSVMSTRKVDGRSEDEDEGHVTENSDNASVDTGQAESLESR
ncbi:solute carrier family 15 member 4-like [Ischnura elegans]|uniref:solute carrier family 15 member 4-like n=1 Tax=Ischnura elegans TaxID=197161 RepID=UPI001ED86D38|nr:solute carrier family 15 member 4-like [Ischnura elegans]